MPLITPPDISISMENTRVFLVEDDEDIAHLISFHFRACGYDIQVCEHGELALNQIQTYRPNLILLDLMLPGKSGLQICRELKSTVSTKTIPVIMVTAKGAESDVVQGLELGADDYITKPFSPQILLARAKAVLRRQDSANTPSGPTLTRGDIFIDSQRREVSINKNKMDLTFSEFELLNFLAQKPGWVFTRGQIVDAIRGENYAVTERSIDVALVGLRKKLGPAGDYIETVRGVGYRFKEEI